MSLSSPYPQVLYNPLLHNHTVKFQKTFSISPKPIFFPILQGKLWKHLKAHDSNIESHVVAEDNTQANSYYLFPS